MISLQLSLDDFRKIVSRCNMLQTSENSWCNMALNALKYGLGEYPLCRVQLSDFCCICSAAIDPSTAPELCRIFFLLCMTVLRSIHAAISHIDSFYVWLNYLVRCWEDVWYVNKHLRSKYGRSLWIIEQIWGSLPYTQQQVKKNVFHHQFRIRQP